MNKIIRTLMVTGCAALLLTGCGGGEKTQANATTSNTPKAVEYKAPPAVKVSIGSLNGSLQELAGPKIEGVDQATVLAGNKDGFYLALPTGKDKKIVICGYEIKNNVYSPMTKFGKDGKIETDANIIRNISITPKGTVAYMNNGLYLYRDGKTTKLLKNKVEGKYVSYMEIVPEMHIAVLSSPFAVETVTLDDKGNVQEVRKVPNYSKGGEGLKGGTLRGMFAKINEKGTGFDVYANIQYTNKGPSQILLTDGLDKVITTYGLMEGSNKDDQYMNAITDFAVTDKYIVMQNSNHMRIWEKTGKFLGIKQLNNILPKGVTLSKMSSLTGNTVVLTGYNAAKKEVKLFTLSF